MKKVLIVDDCKEIRQLVTTTLDLGEFTVYEASNGEDAVAMARKYGPDLIIMDVVMPGPIDGIEATRMIKSIPETADCQVIILTGSRKNLRKESFNAGASDVFTKPFSPLDLISKVEQILGIAT
jgi:CheY-like chemotaxis protein